VDYSKCPEKQPALMIIKYQGRNIAALARIIDVLDHELRAALHGVIRPNVTVRERLPLVLGVPLVSCFTEAALTVPERHPEPLA
jgi:hypothetical protein